MLAIRKKTLDPGISLALHNAQSIVTLNEYVHREDSNQDLAARGVRPTFDERNERTERLAIQRGWEPVPFTAHYPP